MAIEKTLVIIKPDGVRMRLVEKILERYQSEDLALLGKVHYLTFSRTEAEALYCEHRHKFYFTGTILAMTSGESVAFVLEGENAIARIRELNGPTDPSKAPPGTIRHDFRSAGGPFNTVHASDSVEAAKREIQILSVFFDTGADEGIWAYAIGNE